MSHEKVSEEVNAYILERNLEVQKYQQSHEQVNKMLD